MSHQVGFFVVPILLPLVLSRVVLGPVGGTLGGEVGVLPPHTLQSLEVCLVL